VLETELREESEIDRRIADSNFAKYDGRLAWLLGLRRDIDTMIATGGNAKAPAREPKQGETIMQTAAWDTARSDGRLVLLPDEESANYSLAYRSLESPSAT
jgi:hypothetical protein